MRLTGLASRVKTKFGYHKFNLKQRLNLLDPLQILPYRGYGTPHRLYLRGRVLEKKGITTLEELSQNTSTWTNIVDTFRRLESDEVPGARLLAHFREREIELVADEEGFFVLDLDLAQPIRVFDLWQAVGLELIEPKIADQPTVRAVGQVLIPPAEARFGVISDIDDTVIKSEATNFFKMLRILFLGNAQTRTPFEGVADFYQTLQQGPDRQLQNPLFYVSSSPWNLYDLLIDIFQLRNIPLGPLLLRDYGISRDEILPLDHKKHKLNKIGAILDTYPDLSFILIGDSGQKDPEIYRQVVEHYPDRILAIYIRDVTGHKRDGHIQEIVESTADHGVEMLLMPDTAAAVQHAVERDFISPA